MISGGLVKRCVGLFTNGQWTDIKGNYSLTARGSLRRLATGQIG